MNRPQRQRTIEPRVVWARRITRDQSDLLACRANIRGRDRTVQDITLADVGGHYPTGACCHINDQVLIVVSIDNQILARGQKTAVDIVDGRGSPSALSNRCKNSADGDGGTVCAFDHTACGDVLRARTNDKAAGLRNQCCADHRVTATINVQCGGIGRLGVGKCPAARSTTCQRQRLCSSFNVFDNCLRRGDTRGDSNPLGTDRGRVQVGCQGRIQFRQRN